MRIDLDHLRTFYEVVRAGNMTKAAENMHISQPSVSRIILILEERLEVKLFERTPHGLMLTVEGERLYELATRVIQDAQNVMRHIRGEEEDIEGEVKIITTPFMGTEWVLDHLTSFLNEHPKTRIKIIGQMENINVNSADLAICTYMPYNLDLIQKPLKSFRMGLYASPEYLEKNGMPQQADDLDQHKLICYAEDLVSPYGDCTWILNTQAERGSPRKPYIQINSLTGLFKAALNNLGIAELPNFPTIVNSKLVEVLPELKGPIVDVYSIYPQRLKNSKRILSIIEFLESKAREEVSGKSQRLNTEDKKN